MIDNGYRSPLLIGGSGFIGTHLARHLRQKCFAPIILGRQLECDLVCDLNEPETIPSSLLRERVIVHLATSIVPAPLTAENLLVVEAELAAFRRFLLHADASQCARVIFLSSGGCVYGPSITTNIREDHPTRPINTYGYLKLACESLLGLFRHQRGLETITLRPSNCYGPQQKMRHGQGVIAGFIQAIRTGGKITLFGDGSVERDYICVHDLVAAIELLITAPMPAQSVFNLSSGRTHSLRWILNELSSYHSGSFEVLQKPARAFDAPRIGLDPSALMEAIPWQPRVLLRQGLREQWDAFYQ